MPPDHRRADRAGDVVVPRRDIDHQRAQRVERRLVAPFHFLVHLLFDLVHWDVPGTLDHHLNVVLPGLFRQLAEHLQFRELRFVARIRDAPGPQTIAKRKTHVVLLENLANRLDVFIQEILLLVMFHPVRHQRPASAHDAGNALAHQRHMLAQHSRVDGHVIDALFGLLLDDFQHQRDGEIFRTPHPRDGLINRHRSHGHRRSLDDRLADFRYLAPRGKIHYRVCPKMYGVMELLQLFVDVGRCGRVADVRVDLALGGDADGHRLEVAMIDVGGKDAAPASDFAAQQLRLELLAPGDILHLFRDHALPREMHLRNVALSIAPRRSQPLFNPLFTHAHGAPRNRVQRLATDCESPEAQSRGRKWNYGTWA